MATRAPEIEARTNIQAMKSQRLVGKNRSFSIGGELESCASNDIPLQFESISEELQREKSSVISKPKSVASYKTQRRHNNRVKKKTTQILTCFSNILRSHYYVVHVCFAASGNEKRPETTK